MEGVALLLSPGFAGNSRSRVVMVGGSLMRCEHTDGELWDRASRCASLIVSMGPTGRGELGAGRWWTREQEVGGRWPRHEGAMGSQVMKPTNRDLKDSSDGGSGEAAKMLRKQEGHTSRGEACSVV